MINPSASENEGPSRGTTTRAMRAPTGIAASPNTTTSRSAVRASRRRPTSRSTHELTRLSPRPRAAQVTSSLAVATDM